MKAVSVRAMTPLVIGAALAPVGAQSSVDTIRAGAIQIEIGASRGNVQVDIRWMNVARAIVLVAPDAIIESPGPPAVYPLRPVAVHLSITPDVVHQLENDAARELALPDSIRTTPNGLSAHRVALRTNSPASLYAERLLRRSDASMYVFGAWTCRQRGLSAEMRHERWRSILASLGRAADSAVAQRRRADHAGLTRGSPSADEVACPAAPFRGNDAVTSVVGAEYLGPAHTSVVDLIVDATGAVAPMSIELATGDSSLFQSARRVLPRWRFMPAVDGDRNPITQRLRILVVDRAPSTAADTASLFDRSRTARADLATVAAQTPAVRELAIPTNDSQSTIRALAFGDFPDVVFIHTMGGRANQWRDVAAGIRSIAPSVAYDLRGHGGSTRSGMADYSIGGHIADLEAVLTASTALRVILVAHGASAAIAAEFARKYPARVRALVLIAPTAPDTLATKGANAMHFFQGVLGNRYRLDLLGLTGTDYLAYIDELAPYYAEIVNSLRTTAPDALAASLANTSSVDLIASVAAFGGPTYVLFPYGTSRVPMPEPMRLFEWKPAGGVMTPNVRVTRIDAGSWMTVLQPRETTEWLRRIIAEVKQAR